MRNLVLLLALSGAALHAQSTTLPKIDLARHDADWRVTYTFEAPATSMQFARVDTQGNRAYMWTPVDAAFEIARVDGVEIVRRFDGASFTQAAFDMVPRYVPLEKDYAPFSPFGDGGLLIHTGRFFACAPACGDGVLTWNVSITPPAGSHVIHDGRISDQPLSFVDRDSGTNLYVGAAKPIENDHVVAVIDDAFPRQARDQLTQLFPRLMDFYAERLGTLPAKPMLFASNDEKHPGGGFGHQGGILPGQVFVHLYGRQKNDDPAAFADGLSAFFAHEAGHLYQRYENSQDHNAWMHEGGADAFSLLALSELNLLSPEARLARTRDALDACADGIAGFALDASARRGKFDNYYRCGMLMHLAVDAAARRRSEGACDLFCVWREFHVRLKAGQPWSEATYLAVVADLGDVRTAQFIRELATKRQRDPATFLHAGLKSAGVEVAASIDAAP